MNNLSDFLLATAARTPESVALIYRGANLSYGDLERQVMRAADAFVASGLQRFDRIAIFMEKHFETAVAILAAARTGLIFVPVNPQLKPRQVRHILTDSCAQVLVTTAARYNSLCRDLDDLPIEVVLGDNGRPDAQGGRHRVRSWTEHGELATGAQPWRSVDQDPAAILYTSGSTGAPKGIVLSHRNLIAGATSVNQYLENTSRDVIVSLLPLSFDAGLSQLTTALATGAKLVLHDYLRPQEVAKLCAEYGATSITGVPPLWMQLASVPWTEQASRSLRLFANTGGHMPRNLLDRLRQIFARAKPYLMYGLTEAFRSTYLDPAEVDRRPGSIGKAVPNAEIYVLRPDGTPSAPNEPGELVHRGAFVTLGYWNDPERTAQRFRPLPPALANIPLAEMAVWSGDIVRKDEEGFLYFVSRNDDLIKTSGYRVSFTEIEEAVFDSGMISEGIAIGVPHAQLGQAICIVVVPANDRFDQGALLAHCRRELPTYMVPSAVFLADSLPRNMNGKIDRKKLTADYRSHFEMDERGPS